ncbi:MAG: hypothetical protein HWD82_09775 [Flavobacteriaceae bacterium]|nr:hypothetical protein [Flavobacteriaceae bacterium]
MTTEENVKFVKNLLIDKVRDLYPNVILKDFNLDKLFKEELVSIPDDELMENKLLKLYPKSWLNES